MAPSPMASELGGQVGTAEDQISAGLGLEGQDLGRREVVDDPGVPVGPLQGARVHDLRDVPPDPGELDHRGGGGGVLVGSGPEIGRQLVHEPAFDQSSGLGQPVVEVTVVEVTVELLVDHVSADVAVRPLHVAVDRRRGGPDDPAHLSVPPSTAVTAQTMLTPPTQATEQQFGQRGGAVPGGATPSQITAEA